MIAKCVFAWLLLCPCNVIQVVQRPGHALLEPGLLDSGLQDGEPDGCCIQWVPGQAKTCSDGIKKKQCAADSKAVNANFLWHVGKCVPSDCP
jgi:hypothetical protein